MERAFATDERRSRKELLDVLKIEEAVVSARGFRTTPQSSRLYLEPFRDSITCLNFSRETLEPCDQCWLLHFVPGNHHQNALPCHQIPLNQKGETVVSLESRGDIERLEKEVLVWLRGEIAKLERELKENAERPAVATV
jgi:hypothetical protein